MKALAPGIAEKKTMMEALKFIFSSFWVFIGTLIMIEIVLLGFAEIIKAIRRK